MNEIVKKYLKIYDEWIKNMEEFHEESLKFVPDANLNPDNALIVEAMQLARFNLLELERLKAYRQYLADTYLKK